MRLTLRVLLISNYLNIFGASLFSPLYVIYAQRLGFDILVISSSIGFYTLIAGLTLLVAGKFEDLFKRKQRIIVYSYFFLALGAISFLFVQNLIGLFLVQGLNAVAAGILMPAWKALYTKSGKRGKEAQEWSFFDGGNMILSAAGAILGGFLIQYYGFVTLILIMFVMQIIAAGFSIRLVGNYRYR